MHIQYMDMYPVQFKRVVWLSEQECFDCVVEDDCLNKFGQNDDIEELIDLPDILRDAKKYGWPGFDKIFRINVA